MAYETYKDYEPDGGSKGSGETDPLEEALSLKPLSEKVGNYIEFLRGLKGSVPYVRTAAAVALDALMKMGAEDPALEPDPERRSFLEMLKESNVPSLYAFKHAAGTQRFAVQVMNILKSMAANGQQLYQMITFEGGAGAGKDFFLEGFMKALQEYGEVYAVAGCAHHENPLNALHLLTKEQRSTIASMADMKASEVEDLLAVAGKPCQHCFNKVFGKIGDKPNPTPNLKVLEVEKIRLEPRSGGIAQWAPGAEYSLAAALKMGNRGLLSMPDGFIARQARDGETDERLLLLDATQERRVPASRSGSTQVSAPAPLDCVIIATTNAQAYKNFLNSLPDQNAFTSRNIKLVMPYNLIRVEEERAYRSILARATEKADFDPLVLKMLATVAVLSRFAVPPPQSDFVHPIDKMRRYNGDAYLDIKLQPAGAYNEIWGPNAKATLDATAIDKDEPLTVGHLWQTAGQNEGMDGLDMRYMLSVVSSINRVAVEALKRKALRRSRKKASKDDQDEGRDSVITLEVMDMLRRTLKEKVKDNALTAEQQNVHRRVFYWLGGEKRWGAEPQLIEREYRRLLKQQILSVFSPDYERRAEKLYAEYIVHAPALFQGVPTVHDPYLKQEVAVRSELVNELDRIMANKGPNGQLTSKDRFGGAALQVARDDARAKFVAEHPDDPNAFVKFQENWRSIPQLAIAIATKLDADVGKAVEKILSTEIVTDLSPEDQKLFEKATKALEEAGYSKAVQKPVLEYAKRVQVWAHKE